MEEIIHSIISTYIFAFAAVIFGIWELRDTIKNTQHYEESALQPFLRGIAAGIGSIVLGIIIIYFKIKGKL